MKSIRVYDNREEAEAARRRLEAHRDSKASAEVIGPDDAAAQARLEQAEVSEEEAVSALGHLQEGRALLIVHHGLLDAMRLNDLLGGEG